MKARRIIKRKQTLVQRPIFRKLAGLLLLAMIAAVGLVWRAHDIGPKPARPPLSPPTAMQYNSAQSMLRDIDHVAQAEFASDYSASLNPWSAENSYTGSAQLAPGFPFKVFAGSEPTLFIAQTDGPDPAVAAPQSAAAVYDAIKPKLTQYGFTQDSQLQLNSTQEPTYIFVKQDMTCTDRVATTPPGSSLIVNTVLINCNSSAMARYMASRLQVFAQITARGLQVPVSQITIGPVSIKTQPAAAGQTVAIAKSETPGYVLAESLFKQGNGRVWVGLYYQKDNAWHYITKATDEWGFPCMPVMANPDARKAMYDQVCYEQGIGQIRVDSNRRALP